MNVLNVKAKQRKVAEKRRQFCPREFNDDKRIKI